MILKKRIGMRSFLAVLMAAVLVIAAGCQAVGGVDFNQMLKQSLKVTSMEGSQSLEIQLLLKDGALEELPEQEAAIISMLSNLKLELNDIKMKDYSNMSLNGKLQMGEKSLSFSVKMSDQLAIINIEGAKRPFRIDLTDASFGGMLPVEASPIAEVDSESKAEMTEVFKQVIDHVGGYMIDNLPNPNKLSVKPVQDTVNGESLNLFHVQAEVDGTELLPWVKSYLNALISDKDGLSVMLEGLVNVMIEHPDLMEAFGMPFDGDMSEESLDGQSTEQFIQEGVDEIMLMLEEALEELEALEEEQAESLAVVLNENTYMKADLYVDSKLDIRKSVIETVIKPAFTKEDEEMMAEIPFEGILIRTTGESWNVNGNVTSEVPVKHWFDVKPEELSEMQPFEIARLFDSESLVYGILKDMGLLKQTVMMHPVYEMNPPIITPDGITLIPLRDTVMQLGGSLAYQPESKTYTVYDKGTRSKLIVMKDSSSVKLNKNDLTWSFPVTNIGGTLYVPARDFITSLGGTIKWETYFGDEKILILEREL